MIEVDGLRAYFHIKYALYIYHNQYFEHGMISKNELGDLA